MALLETVNRSGKQIRPFAKFYLTIKIPFSIVIFLGFVILGCVSSLTLTRRGQENKHFPSLIYFYSSASRFVSPSPKMSIATPAKGQGSILSYRPLSLFSFSSPSSRNSFYFSFSTQECKWVLKTMKPGKIDKSLCATSYWLTFYLEWVTVYTSTFNEAWIRTSSTTASYMSYSGLWEFS